MKLRWAAVLPIVAMALQLGLARLLDTLGLIEGLLSPSRASPALLLPLALVFYATRMFAWFVAPGLVLSELCVSFRPASRKRI